MAKSSKGKKNILKVDMTGVESGGKRRFPEGDYKVSITSAARGVNKNTENPQVKVQFEILDGPSSKGSTVTDYITLTKASMWRFGNLMDAVGIKWSAKALEINLDKFIGKELGITLTDDDYGGKVKSKVSDYLDFETINGILDGSDDDDDEDDDSEDDDDEDADDEVDVDDDDDDDDL